MPLAYFRRPLAVAVLLYIVLLAGLRQAGFLRSRLPRPLIRYSRLPVVEVEGTLLSGFSRKRPGDRYWVRLDRIRGERVAPLKALLYVSRRAPGHEALRPGQRVSLRGRLRRPLWPRVPGGFNERKFLDVRGAAAVFHAREVRVARAAVPFYRLAQAAGEEIHRSVHSYFRRRFPAVEAAIIEGILFGYKGTLPPALQRAIQDAGVMHLLTPSGAKVTVVMMWAFALCGLSRLPRGVWPAAAAAAGAGYLLIVGFAPPYTRAYAMALVLYAAHLCDRESGAFQALVISAGVTLLLDPRSLFSAGFQLSYLAMLGILIALPRWRLPPAWPAFVRGAAAAVLICSIVELMLWPTFAAFFGRGSLGGFVVNPIVVPGSGLLMAAGLLAWAASLTPFSWIEAPLAEAALRMASAFTALCRAAAATPGCAVDLTAMTPAQVAAYYLAALGVLRLPGRRVPLVALAAAAALWVLSTAAVSLRRPEVRVIVAGGRGGRASLVTGPGGRHRLVDAGLAPSTLRGLFRVLGVRRLAEVRVTGREPARRRALKRLPELVAVGRVRFDPTASLRFRDLRIRWEPDGVLVSTGKNGDYCIMTGASAAFQKRCPYDRLYSTRRHGAVWIWFDGKEIKIKTQRELHSFGRSVL